MFVTLPLFKAHWAIAGLCQQMGLFERAKQEIDKAIALASPAANAPPPVANVPPVFHVSPTAAIENSMEQRDMLSLMKITEASILIKLGRKDEAVALHKTAIKEIGVHLTEQNAMQVATAYAELAEIYVEKNRCVWVDECIYVQVFVCTVCDYKCKCCNLLSQHQYYSLI